MGERLRRRAMPWWRYSRRFRQCLDRIEVAAELTQRSLQLIGRCSEAEAQLADDHPTDAERYQVVVDALAALVAREIAGLRRSEES